MKSNEISSSPASPGNGEETEARPVTRTDGCASNLLRGYHEHLLTFQGPAKTLPTYAKSFWRVNPRNTLDEKDIKAVFTAHERRCEGNSNAAQCEFVLNSVLAMWPSEAA